MTDPLNFGPWNDLAPHARRHDHALALRLFSSIICGQLHPLTKALLRAEMAAPDALGALAEALVDAGLELERLPALRRRQLLTSYAKHMLSPETGAATRRKGAASERRECAA